MGDGKTSRSGWVEEGPSTLSVHGLFRRTWLESLMLGAYPPMRDALTNKLAHDADEWRNHVRDRDRLLEDGEEMLVVA